MTLPLPEGWEHWPPHAKDKLRDTLRAVRQDMERKPFYCDNPGCDGEPHDGWTVRHARASQRPPVGWWSTWVVLAGRGFGKTRIGAEWSWRMARRFPRGALVAPTAGDTREVMVEGESGILACAPATFRPHYEPSKRRLTYPNGAIQTTYSAEEPNRLRGPQHHYAWGDEFAAWRFLVETEDMLTLGLRLGDDPRLLLTTTPKPRKRLRELVEEPDVVVTTGSTYDNIHNLAAAFKKKIVRKYEGTALGEQELHAKLLADVRGALWNGDLLAAATRDFAALEIAKELARVVIAIDPAVTATEESDETGIVVVGVTHNNTCPLCGPVADGPHGFILDDQSGVYSPNSWASRAIGLYERYDADAVIGEVNNGGDLVGNTIRTISRRVRYRDVRASRGKQARAEPVAALYEQGRIHTARGLDKLDDQKRTWVPGESSEESPDRVDAEVWGVTDLMLDDERGGFVGAG